MYKAVRIHHMMKTQVFTKPLGFSAISLLTPPVTHAGFEGDAA